MDLGPSPLDWNDWAPARIRWSGAKPEVEWCYLGDLRFTDPFFDQTIVKASRRPFSLIFRHQTRIEFLEQVVAASSVLKPSGFIFHVSRCGSTLLSQMFAANPKNIVISEAGPIDFALRLPYAAVPISDEERRRWLQWVVGTFGRRRDGSEEHYVIKLDAWHIFYLPFILEAFPGVPWIFLYRDPVEVMMSHREQPGAVMMPGMIDPQILGLEPPRIAQMTPVEYCARALKRIFEAALEGLDRGGRFVNYSELPAIVTPELSEFFHIPTNDEIRASMAERARFDMKNPMMTFEADSARKQERADESLKGLSETLIGPLYAELEKIRAIKRRSSHVR